MVLQRNKEVRGKEEQKGGGGGERGKRRRNGGEGIKEECREGKMKGAREKGGE